MGQFASLLALELGDSAAAAKLILRTLNNSRSDGPLHLPSQGVLIPSPLFFGFSMDNAMVFTVAGVALIFFPN